MKKNEYYELTRKKGRRALIGVFALFALILFIGQALDDANLESDKALSGDFSRKENQEKSPEGQLSAEFKDKTPWLSQLKEKCDAYEAAHNDIQKSEIFRNSKEFIKQIEFEELPLKLTVLSTNHGGSELDLYFEERESGLKLIKWGIPIGSQIYEQASNLRKGQCVRISGALDSAASLVEKSVVCLPHFRVNLTKIKSCE